MYIEGGVSVSSRKRQRAGPHIQLNVVVRILSRMASRLSEVFRTRNMIMMEGKVQRVTPRNLLVHLGLHQRRVSLRRKRDLMYVAGIFIGPGLSWAGGPNFLLSTFHRDDLSMSDIMIRICDYDHLSC